MSSRVIHNEIGAAIRGLLASIPACDAPRAARADYQVRKAEVLDLIAATDAQLFMQARELAAMARTQACIIAREF
jgi:hypothetical protein